METQTKVIVYLFVYLMHFILKAGFVRESLEWEQRALSRQQDFYTAITTCRCTLADDKKRYKLENYLMLLWHQTHIVILPTF